VALIPISKSFLFRNPTASSAPSSSAGGADAAQSLADANIDSFPDAHNSEHSPPSASSASYHGESPELLPWLRFASGLTDTITSNFKAILLYKPPVGITTVYIFFHLLLKRNKAFVQNLLLDDEGDQQPMSISHKRKKRIGRSLDLDEADGKLCLGLGGVEAVRAELCVAALEEYILPVPPSSSSASIADNDEHIHQPEPDQGQKFDLSHPTTRSEYASAIKDALRVNASPRSAKEDYIESTLAPLARLQGLYDRYPIHLSKQQLRKESYDTDIFWMAAKVAEVRTLDALLRVLREKLLISAVRLSKKEKYRAWRLQWYENGFGKVWKRWFRKFFKGKTVEDDRVNLQLMSAALKREMERLGQVQMLLLNRPAELSESLLLMASSNSNKKTTGQMIDAEGAKIALQAKYNSRSVVAASYEDDSIQKYAIEAHDWTGNTRELVYELAMETLTAAFQPDDKIENDRETTVAYDLQTLSQWATYEKCDLAGWDTALTLSENLSKARLMREQKFLPTAIDLKQLWKQIDLFGVPSSLVVLGAAFIVHRKVYIPYWQEILESGKFLCEAVWGVIEFRFYSPMKDIVLDLLNRREKLLDPFALAIEETSLDNMLRDLGIGDGTKENRPNALAEAARMYESELAQGAIKNLFRGGMVRLLLIQVQQLKTGLLQAMGRIDDLMDSNRLNVQLLATIPAILLVNFGTRIFFRSLYALRSRDLVGLPNAKSEMSDLLRKMERCLLLASHKEDVFELHDIPKEKSAKNSMDALPETLTLQPNELGEFVLHMHQYLVILDFCSPPFPAKGCDSIHFSMQDLLMQGQLSTKRQIALLQVRTFNLI
jgi:nuclear-control-of-ATPase protein 2